MRLATLVTNTDFSDFATARPLDDVKFARLISEVRPGWEVSAYWVCKDVFPEDVTAFDGVMITGSPASVAEGTPWMKRLEDLIRQLIEAEVPLFGACFGHQIIAQSLGVPLIRNPGGWVHGAVEVSRVQRTPWSGPDASFALYGSHIEQVSALPAEAVRLFESPGCPIAGFGIGNTVFTIQHHPEMTQDFITDLIAEYANHVGPDVTEKARRSVAEAQVDRKAFAEEIAAFFEQGAR